MKKAVTIYISDDTHDKLRDVARWEDRAMSRVIARWAEKAWDEAKALAPKKAMVGVKIE